MDIQLTLKLAECPAPTYPLSSNSLMLKTLYLEEKKAHNARVQRAAHKEVEKWTKNMTRLRWNAGLGGGLEKSGSFLRNYWEHKWHTMIINASAVEKNVMTHWYVPIV